MSYTRIEEIIFLTFSIVVIFAMISFIIMTLFFIQKKQKLFGENLSATKTNYERELFKAQLEIQEQTFKEIAREIHDNVGQILSLAKLGLVTLNLDQKTESEESILEISEILEKALDDLRHLSRTMNSELIINGGLKRSIEMQAGFLQRGGKFNINMIVNGLPVKLKEIKEIILFRILQEAVNNVIKHAKATDINISLTYQNNCLLLHVVDNGRGFCISEKMSNINEVNGIYNMQHRAKLIESEFHINSEIGHGTSILVKTPY